MSNSTLPVLLTTAAVERALNLTPRKLKKAISAGALKPTFQTREGGLLFEKTEVDSVASDIVRLSLVRQ